MSSASVQAQIAGRFTPVLVTDESGWIDAETMLSQMQPTQVNLMLAVQRHRSRGFGDSPTQNYCGTCPILKE